MLSMNYFLLCAVFVLIFAYVVYSYMQQDASKAQALKEKVIVIDCRNQNEWDRGHVNVGNVSAKTIPKVRFAGNSEQPMCSSSFGRFGSPKGI